MPEGAGGDFARMCLSKSEGHFSASREWDEWDKMGVKFAASLNMGKNLCKSIVHNELQPT